MSMIAKNKISSSILTACKINSNPSEQQNLFNLSSVVIPNYFQNLNTVKEVGIRSCLPTSKITTPILFENIVSYLEGDERAELVKVTDQLDCDAYYNYKVSQQKKEKDCNYPYPKQMAELKKNLFYIEEFFKIKQDYTKNQIQKLKIFVADFIDSFLKLCLVDSNMKMTFGYIFQFLNKNNLLNQIRKELESCAYTYIFENHSMHKLDFKVSFFVRGRPVIGINCAIVGAILTNDIEFLNMILRHPVCTPIDIITGAEFAAKRFCFFVESLLTFFSKGYNEKKEKFQEKFQERYQLINKKFLEYTSSGKVGAMIFDNYGADFFNALFHAESFIYYILEHAVKLNSSKKLTGDLTKKNFLTFARASIFMKDLTEALNELNLILKKEKNLIHVFENHSKKKLVKKPLPNGMKQPSYWDKKKIIAKLYFSGFLGYYFL